MKLQFGHWNKSEFSGEMTGKKRAVLIASGIAGAVVVVLLIVYMAGINRYQSCFLNGTIIDEVDVSGMSIPELEEQIGKYSLRVIERQADGTTLEEEIPGSEIGISYGSTEPLQAVLQGQKRYLWFLKQDADYKTDAPPFFEESALLEKIDALRGFQKDFMEEPADAYIADYVPGSGFALVAEEKGNRLNRDKTVEAIRAAVAGL